MLPGALTFRIGVLHTSGSVSVASLPRNLFPHQKFPQLRRGYALSKLADRSLLDKLEQSSRHVTVDVSHPSGVALLAMNFRAKKNALSKVFVNDLSDAVDFLEKDQHSKLAIICSLIPDVFCAGADLKERAQVPDDQVPTLVGGLRSLFQRIYSLPQPTVAAIDGAALGGGLELALACDIRFAGNRPSCQIGLIETHWALLPGAGGSQRLPRIIGPARAKELMFSARRLTAPEAAEFGVVNDSVNPVDVPDEWKDRPALYKSFLYADELVTKGPIALRQLKRAVNIGLSFASLERGLDIEGECYKTIVPTADRKEGMKAFIERRKPVYCGH